MPRVLDPFRFVLIAVGGWMNQHQLQIIDYLREENRVLREQLGGRRVRFNDDQRRRLAAKGVDRGCGFFHRGSLDPARATAVHGAVLYRTCDTTRRDRRDRVYGEWPVDEI